MDGDRGSTHRRRSVKVRPSAMRSVVPARPRALIVRDRPNPTARALPSTVRHRDNPTGVPRGGRVRRSRHPSFVGRHGSSSGERKWQGERWEERQGKVAIRGHCPDGANAGRRLVRKAEHPAHASTTSRQTRTTGAGADRSRSREMGLTAGFGVTPEPCGRGAGRIAPGGLSTVDRASAAPVVLRSSVRRGHVESPDATGRRGSARALAIADDENRSTAHQTAGEKRGFTWNALAGRAAACG